MTRCLLFDCDGTLVDSERLCNIGLSVLFNDLGVSLDADELASRFRGWKLSVILDQLKAEHSLEVPESFIPAYRALVSELFDKELQPVKGISEALEQLNYPKAVVSSGPRQKIEQALGICNLLQFFPEQNIYSSYEIGAWKPDPKVYEFAAQDMGYSPADCSVIEDGLVGIEAAAEAGANPYFYNVYDEQCKWPGVISFSSMSELPELIAYNQSL